jgi:3-methyl-2-oxobutanoate hydroxymethyltransferase
MSEAFTFKFVNRYANIGEQIVKALRNLKQDVEGGGFLGPEHCYGMPKEEIERLQRMLK